MTTDCGPVVLLLSRVCFKIGHVSAKDYANLSRTHIERPTSVKRAEGGRLMVVNLYLCTRTQTIEKQIVHHEIKNKYPAFLLLLRERTLVAASHLAAKLWQPTRIYLLGGG